VKLIYHFPDDNLHIDYLVNPIPALAVFGMALNDHWWKWSYSSWLTGKISDFLGVFYFPIFVCAVICLVRNYVFNQRRLKVAYISAPMMVVAMSFTTLLMLTIKLSPSAAHAVQSCFSSYLFKIQIIPDPTDLFALVSLPLSYVYARQFFNNRPKGSGH
jgi:hypothetical protein